MNVYNLEVSENDCKNSPNIGERDLALFARALGILVSVGVPILDALNTAAKITPNVRLRWIALHVAECIRQGKNMGDAFESARKALGRLADDLDEAFVFLVNQGEERGELDTMLFAYSTLCALESQELGRQIGWCEEVGDFTFGMAVLLNVDLRFTQALQILLLRSQGALRMFICEVADRIEKGAMLWEILTDHSNLFDPFYIMVVRAAESGGQLEKAFDILLSC